MQVPDAKKPGELIVHLQTVNFGAPYWVFQLGPENYGPDGQYAYSIVSDPFKATLFVLARNVTDFYALYEKDVDAFLAENGWNQVGLALSDGVLMPEMQFML
jgi:lipocalin